ncbi:MAG: hypothetical protein B7Z02_06760 [Rhodobacterales bacterium 32-67-9]|nr:MAG: hypothetical protein B7Z02_06760 [Rhodobacterales bacterium 32-67-9]
MKPVASGQDVVVVGGGLVGLAVAYGLARRGRSVLVLDEGDEARPASVGNFGLVWTQSKGLGLPAYSAWTARSARLWTDFAATLAAETGIDVRYRQVGGLHLCLNEAEVEARTRFVAQMQSQMVTAGVRVEMLDRAQTRDLAPAISNAVVGASWSPLDGDANPLFLMRSLIEAGQTQGMRRRTRQRVAAIRPGDAGYELELHDGTRLSAARVVLAAGLGNAVLAASLGKSFPVRPERGQILVTRRMPRFLGLPTSLVRQTDEGSVLLGDSKEDVGFDYGTTPEIGARIAARSIASFPVLRTATVVRSWGALRVMSPDGFPIYQTWPDLPGLWALACHSGVTLAAAHAGPLADAIDGGAAPAEISQFTTGRFDVPSARAV